jgi:hypothetical protein
VKPSSKIALAVAVLLLLVGGIMVGIGRTQKPSPERLIVQSLQDAEDAARRGSVNGVMDTISEDFRAGGWDRGKIKLLLLRTMAQGRGTNYDVHVNQPRIMKSPKGREDERLVVTRFAAFYAGTGEDIYKTGEGVILVMREETRSKWLVFREPYWRVVGVVNLPALPGSDSPGDSGGGGSLF